MTTTLSPRRIAMNLVKFGCIVMNKLVSLLILVCLVFFAHVAQADDHATKDQAEAMVKKAVAYIKANGPDKAYAEIDNHNGQFRDRELYVVVYDLTGKCLAHGAIEEFLGMDLIDAQDATGKFYVQERIEAAKTKDKFWIDYIFEDPVTKQLEPKTTYCEKLNDSLVCAGVYNAPQ
jgi:cytochrome c